MASVKKRPDGQWRARYRDDAGKEHARHFGRKLDGQRWLDEVTTAIGTGTYVSPKTARTTVTSGARRGWPGTPPAAPRRSGRRACTWRRSWPSSGPCRCRRSGRRTSARGRHGCVPSRWRPPTSTRCMPAWRRSWPTRCMTGSSPGRRARAARRPAPGSSGPTSPAQNRSGRCTTPCRNTCAPRSCSARSPGCGSPRPAGSAWPTWTSCAASSPRPCSTRPRNSRPRSAGRAIPIPASLALELAAHLQQHPGETLLTSPRGQLEPWAAGACHPHGPRQGGRPPGRLPVPRPAALPRVAPDRQRRRRQDRAGPAAARLGQDHARHLRPPLARPGRVHRAPRWTRCSQDRADSVRTKRAAR